LFALLDESKARVRMLVAPAGYGKTTLAEQWVARDGRRGAWFTARSSATDVAALALGIARSSTAIVEECDARLREHLRALPAPAENVETLAEILGEDLAEWPSDAWLVIDDYHEVAQEPRAEDFVAALMSVSPIQFLIASRVRPSWISTKELMYGDVLELTQTSLAMDNLEAADVLVGRSARSASGLVSLANGWPAVIGLASVSSAETDDGADQLPESLYRFFADEVFSALGGNVQQGLTTLAVAPLLDFELAVELLGADTAESVCAAAVDVGLLVERDAYLDLHPLARVFLEERNAQFGLVPADDAARVCLKRYRDRRDWDPAFELIVEANATSELEALMAGALDELLQTARLSTLQKWCEIATDAGIDAPVFALARAETTLRHGRHAEAVAHAEAAAAGDPAFEFRGLSVAGRAAHLASREEDALQFYRRAESVASNETERRDALWGQLSCYIDLELPDASSTLERLASEVSMADPRERVRASGHRLYLQLRGGSIDLDDADAVRCLTPVVRDPIVESAFLSGYAMALGLAARYDDARVAGEDLLAIAERYRLDFARPYGLCATAIACSGLRQWRRAESLIQEALSLARSVRDAHSELLGASLEIRQLVQRGRHAEALQVAIPSGRTALAASAAEALCSRALALACVGRAAEAISLVEGSPQSNAVEPVVLSSAVRAICSLRTGDRNATDRVGELEATAVTTGAIDLLVTAYRACPEILSILLRSRQSCRVTDLVRRVGDADLAAVVGVPMVEDGDRVSLLSPRERDVYELLRGGLTNRQIAKALFIEESTVKVHAHHIYDKLGIRSRTVLTVQAVLERSDQATSATGSPASDDSSS
jgi:ATP/maltotriose-dependent transcriptional regulator MalT